ncbi:hypothetical protein XBO1_410006 [Xenorhabdus bovienii str. oregonense]|uniref:Uncharacterized protein n=1 Tax=Xenorhabdus bovienii str. oregonense TaxID=1398202 RepID=A0A077P9T0_XENBV|nr:hypothetical protein XBO1_410006 [Xenorhabdus bovienii str. oregonense]
MQIGSLEVKIIGKARLDVSNLRLETRVGAKPQIITPRGISLWR